MPGYDLYAGGQVPAVPQMSRHDPLPAGPYRKALTNYGSYVAEPWVILADNGQCVCGWIQSQQCAVAIEAALNLQFPPS